MNKKQESILKKAAKKLGKDELVLTGSSKDINPIHKLPKQKRKRKNGMK